MQQTVLVIDDDAQILDALEYALTAEGKLVRVATDGATGVAMARAFRPAVIVLDLNMPGVDGREAIRLLRVQEETRLTPILAFTSETLGPMEQSALLDDGFSACLSKHSGLDGLLHALNTLAA